MNGRKNLTNCFLNLLPVLGLTGERGFIFPVRISQRIKDKIKIKKSLSLCNDVIITCAYIINFPDYVW